MNARRRTRVHASLGEFDEMPRHNGLTFLPAGIVQDLVAVTDVGDKIFADREQLGGFFLTQSAVLASRLIDPNPHRCLLSFPADAGRATTARAFEDTRR